MIRLKIVKPYKRYTKGQVVYVSKNVAFGLIDGGYATLTKDMVDTEIRKK